MLEIKSSQFTLQENDLFKLSSYLHVYKKSNFFLITIDKNEPLSIILLFSLLSQNKTILPISFKSTPFDINIIEKDFPFEHFIDLRDSNYKNKLNQELIDSHYYKLDQCDFSLVVRTSGSTGTAKCIQIDQEQIFSSAKLINSILNPSNFNLSWDLTLPLNHIGGLMVLFRQYLMRNRVNIIDQQIVAKSGHGIVSLVPGQILKHLKSSQGINYLKTYSEVIIGGGPLKDEIIRKLIELNISFRLSYGMTETCSMIALSESGQKDLKLFQGVDATTDHQSVLSIDSPTLARGIWKNRKLVFLGTPFKTSDQVTLNHRNLNILGRIDNVFIRNGENISPLEVSNAILTLPQIFECQVIPFEDDEKGNLNIAWVNNNATTSEDLKKLLVNILPVYKIPDFIFYFPDIKEEQLKYSLTELQSMTGILLGRTT
ncbi:MAG: AMP-binding protein [Halobacteriovoraceae bacterium]|nr:AMP-binding protein [Halobacteriovoraceae bacterium]